MKILCLLDSVVKPGDRWMWNYLPAGLDEVDFLYTVTRDRFGKWGKLVSSYPAYFNLGWRTFLSCKQKQYDLVVAWETKLGFPIAFFREIFHQHTPPLVILAFGYRGLIQYFPGLGQFIMKAVDHITVSTRHEMEQYNHIFHLKPGQSSICLLGAYDVWEGRQQQNLPPTEDFVLSTGRSYRDYSTLAKAMETLPQIPLTIIARKFNLKGIQLPGHVHAIDLLPMEEYWKLQIQARFLVLPLQMVSHEVGVVSLLQAMSAGKAIIATRTYSTEAYLEDGVTGILVSPGDVDEMHKAIQRLWEGRRLCEEMGIAARQRYEQFFRQEQYAKRMHEILKKVVFSA